MFKTTEQDLKAIGDFFEQFAQALVPEGVEVKQQFPWSQAAQEVEDIINESFTQAREMVAKKDNQTLKAAKLYISRAEIAKRLGIKNEGSIVVTDVQNNNTSDSSVELTVFIDSTAKQDLESAVEIADLIDGNTQNLRRQTFTKPECNAACKYKTVVDQLNEALHDALNERDVLLAVYGDGVHIPEGLKDTDPISKVQYDFKNVKKNIDALTRVIEIFS